MTANDVYNQDFVKIGNGKGTTFETTRTELQKLMNDIPLMISFVDSGENQ
jgi:hypothetical protein